MEYKKDICESCGEEFGYDPNSVSYGEFGLGYIMCPFCGQKTWLNDECYRLTTRNLRFPKHFHHTSVATGASDFLEPEDIEEYIRLGISYLQQNPDCEYYAYTCGCVSITIIRLKIQGEYHVHVSKDFYETYINCEDEERAYEN